MKNFSAILNRPVFQGVDYVKFIMALCVVAIHVDSASCVLTHWSPCVVWLIRLAVPFFFISSGFLLARKLEKLSESAERRKAVFRRAVRIFRIFACWLMIYLPITIYLDINDGRTLAYDIVGYIGRVVISGDSEYAYPLWFLYSMAIVLTIYGVFYKFRHIEWLLWFVFALILAANTLQPWEDSWNNSLLGLFNMLTRRTLGGGVYIMSGLLLYQCRFIPSVGLSLSLIAVSVLLFVMQLPYWELCGGVALFAIALRIGKSGGTSSSWWRSMSMWIYYLHMYVIFFFCIYLGLKDIFLTAPVLYVAVIVPAIAISALLVRLQKTKPCQWLSFLIS